MATLAHDGLTFFYRDEGVGFPFVFQHGLGSDVNQPFELYAPAPGVRLIGFDARAHGQTHPLGDVKKVSLAQTGDDLVALLDALGIERAVVGGISMGASVALSVALRYPSRVVGLVVVRPAWIDRPLPDNTRVFPHIALHLHHHGPEKGLALFRQTPEYRAIQEVSEAAAASLEAQFSHPHAVEFISRLERIPHDCPCHEREELTAINVPTLVMGNRRDPVHPWEMAQSVAGLIPGAVLVELTPKGTSTERHAVEAQHAIDSFFRRHFLLNLKSAP
ncbi:MAG: alpha/beta hydrolase [Isosphaeraceae bacterium]